MRIKIFIYITVLIFCATLTGLNDPVLHKSPDNVNILDRDGLFRTPPPGEEIVSPAEFNNAEGVMIGWPGWGQQILSDIARAVAVDYKVFVVTSSDLMGSAENYLTFSNVNMGNVFFVLDENITNSSMWIRDYGPFYIYEDGETAIVDFFYGIYVGDDEIPYTIAEYADINYYESELLHHGGNFITDGNRMGFCTTNIFEHNQAYSEIEIRNDFQQFLGIDSLVVIDHLINDGTGHIDMSCKLLNDTLFIVGEYENPEDGFPGNYELLNDMTEYFQSLVNLDGRPFAVERVPMPPLGYDGPAGIVPYSYTNSLIINNKVLVPVYGFESDQTALDIYQDLMPGYEIIGIDSDFIIDWWGAVHCVSKLYYGEDPLIILHEPVMESQNNTTTEISFRVNPKFSRSDASVFFRNISDTDFIEIEASHFQGIWTAEIPVSIENIEYYINGNSISGVTNFQALLPSSAPSNVFTIEVIQTGTEDLIPEEISLLSNHPNPFNPSTIISFQISGISNYQKAEIEVYNLKGQKIKTFNIIPDSNSPDEDGSVVWDGSDDQGQSVSSGLYLYQLKLNGQLKAANKCILLK